MAQPQIFEQDLEIISGDHRISAAGDRRSPTPASSSTPSLSRNSSSSRLNAGAPEFVPRAASVPSPPPARPDVHHPAPPARIHRGHGHPAAHHQVFHSTPPSTPFVPPSPPARNGVYEYFGGRFGEQDDTPVQADPDSDGLSDELARKITKQVEYYFSDVNLATTEHLMRFISKDPEGYVPMSVIASFKKIKALIYNYSLLADALRTSSKLVVSDDGKKVRRDQPFTDSDVEELQSRIIVAENLPEDHCYQNLMKIFSVAGRVKTIRTCYPQTPNGIAVATNRSTKMDMLFGNKVHAFVEYETVEDAERAVAELNDERNWRTGLRARLLHRCMTKHVPGRVRKVGCEGDGNGEEIDASTTNQPNQKQAEDPFQSPEALELKVEDGFGDREGGARRGRGRGRGGRDRGRGQYQNGSHHNGSHVIGTPPSSYAIHNEQVAATKQPPGPRMPDGTRGFTMGRGKIPTLTMG